MLERSLISNPLRHLYRLIVRQGCRGGQMRRGLPRRARNAPDTSRTIAPIRSVLIRNPRVVGARVSTEARMTPVRRGRSPRRRGTGEPPARSGASTPSIETAMGWAAELFAETRVLPIIMTVAGPKSSGRVSRRRSGFAEDATGLLARKSSLCIAPVLARYGSR
jgi:hypothetical protein